MQRYLTVSVRHAGCGWMRHAAVHFPGYWNGQHVRSVSCALDEGDCQTAWPLHIGAHLAAKGVLGHMGQIQTISTLTQGKRINFSKYEFSRKPTLDYV